jgi:hypothetical protein
MTMPINIEADNLWIQWAAVGRGVEGFVEADFYGGELVAAAGEGEVLLGEVGVGLGDEREGSCRAWTGR